MNKVKNKRIHLYFYWTVFCFEMLWLSTRLRMSACLSLSYFCCYFWINCCHWLGCASSRPFLSGPLLTPSSTFSSSFMEHFLLLALNLWFPRFLFRAEVRCSLQLPSYCHSQLWLGLPYFQTSMHSDHYTSISTECLVAANQITRPSPDLNGLPLCVSWQV